MTCNSTYEEAKKVNNWQDDNNWILNDRTQVVENIANSIKQQIVIGLDFGTAFTKVVLGEQRTRYAVPFEHFASSDNPYLLPSKLSILNEQKECLIGDVEGAVEVIDDLKMRFLNRDFSEVSKVYIASYIALVLRYARGWLLDTQKNIYHDRKIIWLVNIGLPTDSFDDDKLAEAYGDIVQTAWAVSVLPGPVTLSRIRDYLYRIVIKSETLPEPYASRLLNRDLIDQFPEFAVQLVGYVRSPRRQECLHLLIDVGAGTLDITSFNVHRDRVNGEDRYPIFAQEVKQLGVRYLLSHREKELGKNEWVCSPFKAIPSDNEFAINLGMDAKALSEADSSFRSEIVGLINRLLKYTKEKRYRAESQWENGVPVFCCGGGSSVDFYTKIFQKFESNIPPFKFVQLRLEFPDDLDAPLLPDGSYDRLSVAYGLSYDPYDIGEIIKKSEIEDDLPLQGEEGLKLCLRCNGAGGSTGGCPACGGTGLFKG
jgi:hypothetical protein